MVYRKMKVAFITTTTIGAMTGADTWFSAALISINAITDVFERMYGKGKPLSGLPRAIY